MAQCPAPFTKRDKITNQLQHFPCGKCYFCLRRRVSGWSFRLMQEYNRAYNGYFITFTYNTDHVPITNKGYMTLDKRDWQTFVKRLRKSMKKSKIKYFAVGEYGTKKMRPHYHAIMYNVDISKVEKAWFKGEIFVGTLTEASCGYTLKYMMKKGAIPQHKNDDRLPEFQLMSKGLGENYLTPQIVAWHKQDLLNRFYTPMKQGQMIALPRYYKQKLYTDEERLQIGNYLAQTIEKQELTGEEEVNLYTYVTEQKQRARLQESLE